MGDNYFVVYAEANLVCTILFSILLAHDMRRPIRLEAQQVFDWALMAHIAYFISDIIWAAEIAGVFPRMRWLVAAVSLSNFIFLGSLALFWFFYVAATMDLPLRKTKRGLWLIRAPFCIMLAVLVIAIIAAECGKAVSKETKVDILVTPIVTVLVGIGVAYLIAPPIGKAASAVGKLIMWATELQPFFMGILVSVIVGVALTLPISSAAICAALGLTGLAGGAAVAGCCAQMVGFAIMSFRENRWGGLVSQGLGTSMLQMGNIVRNPRIWIPPTVASAITGPIATCVFRMKMNGTPVSSGMGTCGLVGPIGVYTGWVNDVAEGAKAAIAGMDWVGLVLICFILPGVLTWLISLPCRKAGWIKEGDLKLED